MTTMQSKADTGGSVRSDGPAVREVDATEARTWLDSGEAVLVDVRGADEHAREHIAGSIQLPITAFAAGALPGADRGKVIFHCQTGPRSKEAAARAVKAGRSPVYVLKGGLKAWKAAGLPIVRGEGVPISIMRQVQIFAGSLVLVFSALAATVSPWFIAGTAFMGAGLFFSGASGTCGMAAVLGLMPWNARLRSIQSCDR